MTIGMRDRPLDTQRRHSLAIDSTLDPDGAFGALIRGVACAPSIPLAGDDPLPRLGPGARLDDFEIIRRIGEGGMGVVYEARDRTLDRRVAIKVLRGRWDESAASAAFEREARATARLNHPNIVTLYQIGRADGFSYLVLELLRGESLSVTVRRGPVPEGEAIALVRQVCDALAFAHAQGVVHRDLKPGNLFVDASGRVVVLDFGVAGLSGPERAPPSADLSCPAAAALTRSHGGTPAYMAPEQWRGEQSGTAADIYAVGAVLFELVTGGLPRDPSRPPQPGPPPTARGRGASAALDAVLQRALAHDAADRYPSAAALDAALAAVSGKRTARPRRTTDRRARPGLSVAATAVLAALLFGGWLRTRPDAAPVAPASAALPDLSGRWRSVDVNSEVTTLRRLSPWVYFWDSSNDTQRSAPRHYRNRGFLFVRRTGGRAILEGTLADVPGWCCGNVGATTIEVRGGGVLLVVASHWGASHDFYSFHRRPYWMTRDDAGTPASEVVAQESSLSR